MEESNEVTSMDQEKITSANLNTPKEKVNTMSEVSLKDKMNEINLLVKALDAVVSKNPELQAEFTLNVAYGVKTYASVSRDGDDLRLDIIG